MLRRTLALLAIPFVACAGPSIPDLTAQSSPTGGSTGASGGGSGGSAGQGGRAGSMGSGAASGNGGSGGSTAGNGGGGTGAGGVGGSSGSHGGSSAGDGGSSTVGASGAAMSGSGGGGAAGSSIGTGGSDSGGAGPGGQAGGAGAGPLKDDACDFSAAGLDCITCATASCIDTGSNASHCGACNHACNPGDSCVNSACAPTMVNAANTHTMGVLHQGRLFTWGLNQYLSAWGDATGPWNIYAPREVLAMGKLATAVTGEVSCGVDALGDVRCMGLNHLCQLGLGKSDGPDACDDPPNAWCYGAPTKNPYLARVTEIREGLYWCGGTHVCARSSDRTVSCWGDEGDCDAHDQITYPLAVSELAPSAGLAVSAGSHCSRGCNGRVACWGLNHYQELGRDTGGESSPPQEIPGLRFTSIAAGHEHYCGILEDRSVMCWGKSDYGQSGTTDMVTLPIPVSGVSDVVQLALGTPHSCALTASGEVFCWGDLTYLGTAQTAPTGCENAVCPLAVKADIEGVVEIGSGGEAVVARLADGTYRSWGDNQWGELGNGSNKSSAVPVKVVGLPPP